MIEPIVAAVEGADGALAVGGHEALADAGEGGATAKGVEAGDRRFAVGGDFDSIAGALQIDPKALGTEVLGGDGLPVEAVERVPLLDSKGQARHSVSPAEAEHYQRIGLRPYEVDGRECLVRPDIELNVPRGDRGETNRERVTRGLSPLDANGRPVELHHVGQDGKGMLAQLTLDEHRGPVAYRILHDPGKMSEIDRIEFRKICTRHWQAWMRESQI